MSSHTPGPWVIQDDDALPTDGLIRIQSRPGSAFIVVSKDPFHEDAEQEANARLVAGAPNLLKVAKEVLSHWDDWSDMYDVMAKLRTAINKVEEV